MSFSHLKFIAQGVPPPQIEMHGNNKKNTFYSDTFHSTRTSNFPLELLLPAFNCIQNQLDGGLNA